MKERLTFVEASSIVMGAGVGGGIMAVPYLASRVGLPAFFPIVLVAYAANVLLHLMLVEVLFRDGRDIQIVELIRSYVFRGRVGAIVLWVLFAALLVAFVANRTAYVSGAGELLAELTGLSVTAGRLVAYAASAAIVFAGLKVVGVSQKVAVYGTAVLVLVIVAGVARTDFHVTFSVSGGSSESLALFGMIMYSLYAFFAVPQVVRGLGRDPRKVVLSVVTGLGWNALLVCFFTVVAIGVPAAVTQIAISGIAQAAGRYVDIAGTLFVILALLSSYWSVSLALSDIVHERTGLAPKVSWLVATVPTLVLIVLGLLEFVDYLRIAGGVTGFVVVFVTLPMYLVARREGPVTSPAWRLGRFASAPILIFLALCMVLMAVGSFLGA